MTSYYFSKKLTASITTALLLTSQLLTPFSFMVDETYAAPTILSTLTVTADGIAPFDATTYDSFTDTNTGTDANASNGVVKAGSIIDYDVQVTINDEGSTNVYFSSTVGAGFTWDVLPLGCLTSGVSPVSAITNGGRDILCNLGDTPNGGVDPGTLAVTLRVLVGAGVPNGSTIILTGEVMSDQIGAPVPSTPSGSTLVTRYVAPTSTEPQFEIGKESWLHTQNIDRSTLQYKVFSGLDGFTPGRVIPYMVYIRAPKTAAGFGSSENITIEDTFTLLDENNNPVSHNAELWTWGSALPCSINFQNNNPMNSNSYYPYGRVGQATNAGTVNSVPDSGTINCTQSAPGAPVTIDITGIDMRNISGPTQAAEVGFAPATTYNYQGVYYIWYWVPLTDIDNASLTLTGAYYRNTLSGTGGSIWDPTSTGGTSNYGTGYEPQSDNVQYHFSQFGTGNTHLWGSDQVSTRYGITDVLGARVHSVAFDGSPYNNIFPPFGGSLDQKTGNRIVMPDTEIGQSLVNKFYHYGTGFTASVCEKIDPIKMEFTGNYPNDTNIPVTVYGQPTYEAGLTRQQISEMFQIIPYSGTAVTYTGAVNIEYATTANTPNQRDATCTDADGPWFGSIMAAGTGNITKMRITYVVPTVTESVWVSYRGFMGKKVKPSYSLGVVPAWISSSYDNKVTWEQFDYASYPAHSSVIETDPNYGYVYEYNQYYGGSWFSSADRVTVSSAFARVDKDTIPSGLPSIQLGKDITFILKPTLSGSTSVSFSGSDYVIRDTMAYPLYYVYGSSSLPLDTGYPLVTATGTILQWTLSNITPSSTLPQITYKANTETTSATLAVIPNTVVVSYPYDASPENLRTDIYNISGVQNSQYGISKITPTPEIPVEDILHYQLKYRNFTVLPNIPPESKYIDIFPYVGDGNLGARVKAPSSFTGGFTLLSVSGSNLETFEYTNRSPSQISPDPCHVSNQLLGATGAIYCMLGLVGGSTGTATTKWCDPLDFGTLGCPASLGQATGFRMTLPTVLNNDGLKTVDIYLDSYNNKPGNIYTNTVGTRRQSFNLYTASNQATIHVYGASVGDRIWFDADSDGIQASGTGEYGIGGIKVTLERLLSGSTVATHTTTTDANGNYLFQDLLGGAYRITVDNTLGLTQTYDLDGTGSLNITEFTLGAAEDKRDADFGYVATSASVGDRVWFDTNGDGIQNINENGIGGITINLTDGATVNLSTVTDSLGYYSFTGLTGGSYTISVIPPSGTTQTYDLTGLGTPHSAGFTLGATEIKTNVDFGYNSPLGSLGDQVWLENGTGGTFDAGDMELENIPVTLSGTDSFGNSVSASTVTSSTGFYLFEGLVVGNYTITINPVGYVGYWDFDGTGTLNRIDTSLSAGQNRTDVDFSVKEIPGIGSFGDTVWMDKDRDGSIDGDENFLSGITVSYSGFTWDAQAISGTTITNASGQYLFESMPQGIYAVTLSGVDINLTSTYDLDGTGSVHRVSFSLAGGENKLDVDFGYYYPFGSIGDTIWFDQDNNTIQDPLEQGFSGIIVTLSGTDFLGNTITGTTATNSSGYYIFPNLLSGSYMISSLQPPGTIQTYDLDGTGSTNITSNISLAPGEERGDIDFGYYYPLGSIGDTVWFDANNNGTQDLLEQGFSGVTVTLSGVSASGGIVVLTQVTSATGRYLFTGIPTGTYSVTVTPILGSVATYDLDGTGSLDTSNIAFFGTSSNLTLDFGYLFPLGSIGDTVWLDQNNNSIKDLSEQGFSGIIVTLSGTDFLGNALTGSTITNSSGYYIFQNLLSGSYTVSLSNIPTSVSETYDLDGTITADSSLVSLFVGQNRDDVDFGYLFIPGSIGDRVWFDRDGDGSYGVGDSTLSGIIVTLSGTDFLGNTITGVTITNSSGNYLFTGLPQGTYDVVVTTPPLLTRASYDLDGTGSVHRVSAVVLSAGGSRTDVDFGYAPLPASLGDYVFQDINLNGTQDSIDLALSGITVTLSGMDDLGQPISLSTLTNASGFYLFPDLYSGSYIVSIPIVPSFHNPSYDLDGTGSANTISTTLISGQNRMDVDFGYAPLYGSIGDRIWLDTNNNQVQDSTEIGIASVRVNISGTDMLGNSVSRTMMTSSTGYYLFSELPPGTYTVSITKEGSFSYYLQTYDLDGKDTQNTTSSLILMAGQNRMDVDFGYFLPQSGGSNPLPPSSPPLPPPVVEKKVEEPEIPVKKPVIIHKPVKKVESSIAQGNPSPELGFILPKKLLDTGMVISKKGIRIVKDIRVTTEMMFASKNYGFSSIKEAPQDITFWKKRLREKLGTSYKPLEDGNAESYIVIPSIGIVTPITTMLGSTNKTRFEDYKKLISGNEIKVNPYLHDGVLHYPKSADIGKPGNLIISGHSSYWSTGLGRYKTIFANLMEIDSGEEVWIYQKQADKTYKLFRYKVYASYNTEPTDVNILLPGDSTPKITLFTCTPVGGISGRWIIKGSLIEK